MDFTTISDRCNNYSFENEKYPINFISQIKFIHFGFCLLVLSPIISPSPYSSFTNLTEAPNVPVDWRRSMPP